LAGKNGTCEFNGKLKINVWKPGINCDDEQKAIRYMKKTATDSENIANGTMHHKVWIPEGQTTITITKDRLLNKVWDLGGHKLEAHDQEIMIIFNLGSLMHEHLGLASNVMVWSHAVANEILEEELVA